MILVFLTEESNVLIEEMNALIDAITKQHEASGGLQQISRKVMRHRTQSSPTKKGNFTLAKIKLKNGVA